MIRRNLPAELLFAVLMIALGVWGVRMLSALRPEVLR